MVSAAPILKHLRVIVFIEIASDNLCNDLAVLRDVALLKCVGRVKDSMMRFYSAGPSSSEQSLAPCRYSIFHI